MAGSDESGRQPAQRVIREFQKRRRTLPRWEAPGSTYSVRASVARERCERLTDPRLGEIVQESLHYHDGRRYRLHFYCLMPDHLHAVLEPMPRDGGSVPLPEIMRAVKGFTARQINVLVGARGAFWLDEGFNRIIRCEEEYWHWYSYIRLNPVKAGLVDDPSEWRWWWEIY